MKPPSTEKEAKEQITRMAMNVNAAFKVGTQEGIAFDEKRFEENRKCLKFLERYLEKYKGTRLAQVLSDLNFNEEPSETYYKLRKLDLNLAEELEDRPWRTG